MDFGQGPILLGEDYDNDVFLFRRTLNQAGVKTQVVAMDDGDEIISYLAGEGPFHDRTAFPLPSIIFLDGQLHYRPSLGMLKWIREQPGLKRIPLFVLTGDVNPRVWEDAKNLGALACFEKPFTAANLVAVQAILRDRRDRPE